MTRVATNLGLHMTLTALWLVCASLARAEAIVVVVGKDSPVSELSIGDLQRIFLSLPMQNAHSVPFVPFNYPAKTTLRERFDSVVLGMSPQEVGRHWIDQKIRGHQSPPRTLPSPTLLCRLVARLPGAIAYIPASLLGPQCKVVAIDGLTPEDPGYVLASDAQVRRVVARTSRAAARPRVLVISQRLGQLAEPSSCSSRACSMQSVVPAAAMAQHVQPALQSSPPTLQPRTRHCLSRTPSQ